MLDPYGLNRQETKKEDIIDVESYFRAEYFDLFMESPGDLSRSETAVAIYPRRQIARLASQHGLFTLHLAKSPLEDQIFRSVVAEPEPPDPALTVPEPKNRELPEEEPPLPAMPVLTRFRLCGSAVIEGNRFLRVMGVNDFSLFPDLDGLSRLLRKRIRGGYGLFP
jgi:hypothetical protein